MSTDLAAKEWLRGIEPLRKKGIRCGSPGISNAGHAVSCQLLAQLTSLAFVRLL